MQIQMRGSTPADPSNNILSWEDSTLGFGANFVGVLKLARILKAQVCLLAI